MPDYLVFWGKGRPWGDVPMHPAAYHSLDVAACALVLLKHLPQLRGRLALLLGSSSGPSLIVALIALHDVGKWSRQFQAQAQNPALWPPALGDIAAAPASPRHDEAGLALWRNHLHTLTPGGLDLLPLARAVWGHHRTPVAEEPQRLRAIFGQHGLRCAEDFTRDAMAVLMPSPIALPRTADLARASWLVAGLTMIADWLGSSQAVFEYERPHYDLATYWGTFALPRARRAVERSGVIGLLGIDAYLKRRGDLVKRAHAWIFFGSDIGAPRQQNLIHASDEALEQWIVRALEKEGLTANAKTPYDSAARGEARPVQHRGGRFVTVVCSSEVYHNVADRWPEAVDVATLARYASAFANGALDLAQQQS